MLEDVKAGKNVFFTGSAGLSAFQPCDDQGVLQRDLIGTGKSVLLRAIIRSFPLENGELAVTASTGIAAVNIGGITLHSWAGIGLGLETGEKLAAKIHLAPPFKKVRQRWRRAKCLIIDESTRP